MAGGVTWQGTLDQCYRQCTTDTTCVAFTYHESNSGWVSVSARSMALSMLFTLIAALLKNPKSAVAQCSTIVAAGLAADAATIKEAKVDAAVLKRIKADGICDSAAVLSEWTVSKAGVAGRDKVAEIPGVAKHIPDIKALASGKSIHLHIWFDEQQFTSP